MVKVTKCPAGYALGYNDINSTRRLEEVAADTYDVRICLKIQSAMRNRAGDSVIKNIEDSISRNGWIRKSNWGDNNGKL